MNRIYIVHNQWQMDEETFIIELVHAFSSKQKAEELKNKMKKESKDKYDNFLVGEVDFE
jgi:hypothetical protein